MTPRGGSCRRDTYVCQAAAERKGEISLLSCHGLSFLVSDCEPGVVVSCESHGVICGKSRAFCPALCAITHSLLTACSSDEGKCVLCLQCGRRKPWAYLNAICIPSKVCITHFSCFPMCKAEPCNDICLACEIVVYQLPADMGSSKVKMYGKGQKIINISSGCSGSAQGLAQDERVCAGTPVT